MKRKNKKHITYTQKIAYIIVSVAHCVWWNLLNVKKRFLLAEE